jgi:hypothetical protein
MQGNPEGVAYYPIVCLIDKKYATPSVFWWIFLMNQLQSCHPFRVLVDIFNEPATIMSSLQG